MKNLGGYRNPVGRYLTVDIELSRRTVILRSEGSEAAEATKNLTL